MVTYFSGSTLVCTSDTFSVDLSQYNTSHRQMSGQYQFSYETADFLFRWFHGNVTWSKEADFRCYKIVTRRSCYNPVLIDGFGILSGMGEIALNDAKHLDARRRYYEREHHLDHLWPENATKMDDIILNGALPHKSVKMMRLLWDTLPAGKSQKMHTKIANVQNISVETVMYEAREFVLMSSIRNNTHLRNAADVLIKYGLVDLIDLPKSPDSHGKGRPPVGFALSTLGQRFCADFLKTYDPSTKFQLSVEMSMPKNENLEIPKVPKISENNNKSEKISEIPKISEASEPNKPKMSGRSDSSDIDNGENLRDIFGE